MNDVTDTVTHAPAPGPGPADWNRDVAPLGGVPVEEKPWLGRCARKPWEYRVTAALVHRDTPDLLGAVLAGLRAQTERPYVVVVDTGSDAATRAELDRLEGESDDLEVHYVRSRGWQTTSQPVTAAMDLAFSVCQTEFLFGTHTDVFPKRPDFLAFLLALCDARTPAVGYQMSTRSAWGHEGWREVLSHTASMYHMPTMRRCSVTWNILAAFERLGLRPDVPQLCFPDTENMLSLVMADHGFRLKWADEDDGGPRLLCLGDEPNEPYGTFWHTHMRSASTARLYCPNTLHNLLRLYQCHVLVGETPAKVAGWAAGPPAPVTRDLWEAVVSCPDRGPRVDPTTGARHHCLRYGHAVRTDPDCLHCVCGPPDGGPGRVADTLTLRPL